VLLLTFLVVALTSPGPPPYWKPALARAVSSPFDPPFLADILIGLAFGLGITLWLRSKPAQWAWVLPLAWLVFLTIGERPTLPIEGTFLHATWHNFFSMDPGEEGMGAVFGTAPFYSSVAYSLGAWIALHARRVPHVSR
jgi:hypothetical protein